MATPQPRPVPTQAPAARPAGATTIRQTAPATTSAASRLGKVKRGRLRVPLRHLFYGPEGVGKTSLAADAGNVLFLDIEGGSARIDAPRYLYRDENPATDHVPRSYDEVVAALHDLINNPAHGYDALVIDTIDALESLLHKWICARDGKAGIEGYGYGKGYRAALEEIRHFLSLLDTARARGNMHVIIVGHSTVETFKNPEGEDFDRYQLRLHKLAAGQIKEWSDVVGFIHFEGGGAKLKGDETQSKRARGWATGRRLIELERTAAWDAKCRLQLPPQLELTIARPWEPFANARDVSEDSTIDQQIVQAVTELERITGIPADDAESDVEFTTPSGNTSTRMAMLRLISKRDPNVMARVLPGLRATDSIVATKET